jgi:hypothetical protein
MNAWGAYHELTPESRVPNPESRIPNAESRIPLTVSVR